MSTTVRERIVDNIITALSEITPTGGYYSEVMSVSYWLTPPTEQIEYPCLIVSDPDETIQEKTFDIHTRTLSIIITGTLMIFREANDGAHDSASRLLCDIEDCLQVDVTRGGLAVNTRITGNSITLVDPVSPYVVITVLAEVDYRTLRTSNSTAN